MARIINNPLTEGLSGQLGQFIFRHVGGKTIVSLKSEKQKRISTRQAEVQSKFVLAGLYAKLVVKDPELKAQYDAIAKWKGRTSTALVATSDYMTLATLKHICTIATPGNTGTIILITLKDNYNAKDMLVEISNKDGTVIETGKANFTFGESYWRFDARVDYPTLSGYVQITVSDRIGRVTKFRQAVNSNPSNPETSSPGSLSVLM